MRARDIQGNLHISSSDVRIQGFLRSGGGYVMMVPIGTHLSDDTVPLGTIARDAREKTIHTRAGGR